MCARARSRECVSESVHVCVCAIYFNSDINKGTAGTCTYFTFLSSHIIVTQYCNINLPIALGFLFIKLVSN